MQTIFVTKYALTEGIKEYQAEIVDGINLAKVRGSGPNNILFFHKQDYFFERKDAVKKANEMVSKKIKSLDKQISILKSKKFE